MAYQGALISTRASWLVSDYLSKRMLSKIGYRFDIDELESWEVESYGIIASTLIEEEEREAKKSTARRK